MQYTDSVTKSFLTYGAPGQYKGAVSDYQDPTYIGFNIRIVPSMNGVNLDDFPHGLFTVDPKNDDYSTYNYLIKRGEYKRAMYILEFETRFKALVKECPWYFTKVAGLADIWKVDPSKNFRGKDKVLKFETLESIDMKITYLLDLYRKAIFDFSYMRYAVPDNMRYFKMELIVSEIRTMKIGVTSSNYSKALGKPVNQQSSINKPPVSLSQTIKDQLSVEAAKLKNQFLGDVGLLQPLVSEMGGLVDVGTPWSPATFMKFSFEQCELDVFSEAPKFLESLSSTPDTAATNGINIKTNVIREKNIYGLLGAIVDDTLLYSDYGKDAANKSFYFPSTVAGISIGSVPNNITDVVTTQTDYRAGLNDRKKRQEEFDSANRKNGSTSLLNIIAESTKKAAISAADNVISNVGNRLLLGNAYGVSPSSIIGAAQSIINNPIAAAEALLQKFSSPSIGKDLAKKVELTGEEIQLVKNLIGNAQLQGIVLPPAQLGNAGLQAISINSASPGNANLQGSTPNQQNPGNANLQGAQTPQSNPGNVSLQEAPINTTSPGNAGLQGANVPASALGSADLQPPPTNTNPPGSADLSGVTQPSSAPGKTMLEGVNIIQGSPGNVGLNGAPVNIEAPQKTNLTAFANAGSATGKVVLVGPSTQKSSAGNVDLTEPTVQKAKEKRVNLVSPQIPKKVLGKVKFESPAITKTDLGKTDL
jgi:uncharacterized protein YjbI with pentapeptide repeats